MLQAVSLATFSQVAVSCAMALVLVAILFVAAASFLKGEHESGPAFWRRAKSLHLPVDHGQRVIILRHSVGVANGLAGLVALNFGAQRGAVDPVGCAWLTYSALAVISVIAFMLGSGLNKRLADPTLITPHIVCAEVLLAWGYYLGGPCRGVAMVLLLVVLLSNFFTSTAKIVMKTSLVAAALFGAAMGRVAWEERLLTNGPQIQLVNFCILLIALFSGYLLAIHLIRIRDTSTQRKKELLAAMAHIQNMAIHDELTHLFNRRHMRSLMDAEKSRCLRGGGVFCVGIIDIDHFKRINDQHGHGVGDQVLTSVAAFLKQGIRDIDVVARWGGEEFLIMFAGADMATAETVLGRLLDRARSTVVCAEHPQLRVTFSAGIAQFRDGERLDRTIERADVAMYQSKRSGRSRITCDGDALCDDMVVEEDSGPSRAK